MIKRKHKKLTVNKKENLCVVAVFGLIAVALIGASVMLLIENNGGNVKNILHDNTEIEQGKVEEPTEAPEPGNYGPLDRDEWIDCMPPLDSYEAELCKEAERRGYSKIAY